MLGSLYGNAVWKTSESCSCRASSLKDRFRAVLLKQTRQEQESSMFQAFQGLPAVIVSGASSLCLQQFGRSLKNDGMIAACYRKLRSSCQSLFALVAGFQKCPLHVPNTPCMKALLNGDEGVAIVQSESHLLHFLPACTLAHTLGTETSLLALKQIWLERSAWSLQNGFIEQR